MPDIRTLKNALYKTLEYTTTINNNECVLFSANGSYKIGCYVSTSDFSFYFEVDNNGVYKVTNAKCNTTDKIVTIYFEQTGQGRRYYAQLNSGNFGEVTTRKEIFYGIINAELTASSNEPLENEMVVIDFGTEEIVGSYKIDNNAQVLDINVEEDVVVGGNATVSQNLTVSGSTSIAQNLTVSGEANLNGVTTVISSATLNTLNVTGSTIASNVNSCTTLTLSENTLVSGEASLNTLNITNHTIANDVIANASTTFASNVDVSGNSTLFTLDVKDQSILNNLNVEGLLKSKKSTFTDDKAVWVDDSNNIININDFNPEELAFITASNNEIDQTITVITEYIDANDNTKNRRHLVKVTDYTPLFDVSGNISLNNLTVSANADVNNLVAAGTINQTGSENTINITGNTTIVDIPNITTANINNLNVAGTLDQTGSTNKVTVNGDIDATDVKIAEASVNNFISAGEVYANRVESKGEITIENDTTIQKTIGVDSSDQIQLVKENIGKIFYIQNSPISEVYKVVPNGSEYILLQLAGSIEHAIDFNTTELLVAKYNNNYYDVNATKKLITENLETVSESNINDLLLNNTTTILDNTTTILNNNTIILSKENALLAVKKLFENKLYRLEAASLVAENIKFADLLTVKGTTIIKDKNGELGSIYFGDTNVAVRGVTIEAYGQISVPDEYRYRQENDNIIIEKAEYYTDQNDVIQPFPKIDSENKKDKEKFIGISTIFEDTINPRIKLSTSILGRTLKFADGIITTITKQVPGEDPVKELNVRNKSRILLAVYEGSSSIFVNNLDLYDQYCAKRYDQIFNDNESGCSFDDALAKNIQLTDDIIGGGKYLTLRPKNLLEDEVRKMYPSLLVYADEDDNHNFHIHVQQIRKTIENGEDKYTYLNLDDDAYDFVSETWGINQLNLGTNFLNDKSNNLYILIPSPAIIDSYDVDIEDAEDDSNNEEIEENTDDTNTTTTHNYILQNTISLYATSLEASDDYLMTSKAVYGILNNGATSTTPLASNLSKKSTSNNVLYQQNPTNTKFVPNPITEREQANYTANNYVLTQEGTKAPNFTYKLVNSTYLNDIKDRTGYHHNTNGSLLAYTNNDDYLRTIPTLDYLNKLLELGYTTYFSEEKGYKVYLNNVYNIKTLVDDGTGNQIERLDNSAYIIQFRKPGVGSIEQPEFEENPHARSIYKYTATNADQNKQELKKVLVSYNPIKYDYILPGDYIIVNEDLNYAYENNTLCCRVYDDNSSNSTYAEEGTQNFNALFKYNLTILHNNSIENGKVVYVSNDKIVGNSTNVSSSSNEYNIPLFNYNKVYKEINGIKDTKEYNYEVHNSDIKVKQDVINNNSLTLTGLTSIENLSNVNTTNLNVNTINPISTSINVGNGNGTDLVISTSKTEIIASSTVSLLNNSHNVGLTLNATGICINAGTAGLKIEDDDAKFILHNKKTGSAQGETEVWNDTNNDLNISTNSINVQTTNLNINSTSAVNTNIVISNVNSITANDSTLKVKNVDSELKVSQLDQDYVLVGSNEKYVTGRVYKLVKDIFIETPPSNGIYKPEHFEDTNVTEATFNENKSKIAKLKESILTDNKLYTKDIEAYNIDIAGSANIANIGASSLNASAGSFTTATVTTLTATNRLSSNGETYLNGNTTINKLINSKDTVNQGVTTNSQIEISNGNLNITNTVNNGNSQVSSNVLSVATIDKTINVNTTDLNIASSRVSINSTINQTGDINISGNVGITSGKEITVGNSTVISDTDIETTTLTVNTLTTSNNNNTITVSNGKKLDANFVGTIHDGAAKFYYDTYGSESGLPSINLNTQTPTMFVANVDSITKTGRIRSGYINSITGLSYVKYSDNEITLNNNDNSISIFTGIHNNNKILIGHGPNSYENNTYNSVEISGADITADHIKANKLTVTSTNMLNVTQTDLSTSDRIIELGQTFDENGQVYIDSTNDDSYIGFYAKQLNRDGRTLTEINSTFSNDTDITADVLLKQIDPLDSTLDGTKLKSLHLSDEDIERYTYWYGYDYDASSGKFKANIVLYKIAKGSGTDALGYSPIKIKKSNDTVYIMNGTSSTNTEFRHTDGSSLNYVIIDNMTFGENNPSYLAKGLFLGNDGYWKVGRAITKGDNAINAELSGSMLQDLLTRSANDTNEKRLIHNVNAAVGTYDTLTSTITGIGDNHGLILGYNYDTKRMEGLNFAWEDALRIIDGRITTNLAGNASDINNNHYGIAKIDSMSETISGDASSKVDNGLNINNGIISIDIAGSADQGDVGHYGVVSISSNNGLSISKGIVKVSPASTGGFGTVKISTTDGTAHGLTITEPELDIDNNTELGVLGVSLSSTDNFGTVKISTTDGTAHGLIIDTPGVLGVCLASTDKFGTVKVASGNGLSVIEGVISMGVASGSTPGVVAINQTSTGLTYDSCTGIVGTNISAIVNTDSGLSVSDNTLYINTASTNGFGSIKIDTNTGIDHGLTITEGVLGISPADDKKLGVVQVSTANGLTIGTNNGLLGIARASRAGFGSVKIGSGINVSDGTISIAADGSNIVLASTGTSVNTSYTITLSSDITVSSITVSSFSASTITASQYYVNSDKRLKNISKELDYSATEILDNIKTYSFTYKNDPKAIKHIGVMAQDLKDIDIDGFSFVNMKDDGFYEIKETKLIYLLIKAIQEQKEEIEKLKKQINLGEQ